MMKNKFTSIQLNIRSDQLTVLNVSDNTRLMVDCGQVWLTHTHSNQDYVLQAGAHLTVSAGKVLIDSMQTGNAWVTVSESTQTPALVSWLHTWQRKVQHTPAVCVCVVV
ncbi:hypothetical protein DTO96_101906 [Ephemeroptericola cinctiostellae]|uniref:DUF2917 domain-containing protein n=1 Tax=Ephemeroptericola cinctiostellae TaxID=2268024 RepID=A0A345DCS7_9BURK|nr:DUF2917 domain-containing protein [Ephemeroptericola cinctiostellae]AXF86165.1 hypothetical protein DTO96_101906 [Ephemeroptericola cinctiostellae]